MSGLQCLFLICLDIANVGWDELTVCNLKPEISGIVNLIYTSSWRVGEFGGDGSVVETSIVLNFWPFGQTWNFKVWTLKTHQQPEFQVQSTQEKPAKKVRDVLGLLFVLQKKKHKNIRRKSGGQSMAHLAEKTWWDFNLGRLFWFRNSGKLNSPVEVPSTVDCGHIYVSNKKSTCLIHSAGNLHAWNEISTSHLFLGTALTFLAYTDVSENSGVFPPNHPS